MIYDFTLSRFSLKVIIIFSNLKICFSFVDSKECTTEIHFNHVSGFDTCRPNLIIQLAWHFWNIPKFK